MTQSKDLKMEPTIDDSRLKLGKQLYVFAWIFEICAVLIGLAIALMQGYSSFQEMDRYDINTGFATGTNIFIAAMPFVMVALVEITKIPFVGAFYQSKKFIWKLIFGLTLCFMAAITFESAINGFERNFNALIFGINDYKRSLSATEENIFNLKNQRERFSQLTSEQIDSDFREKYTELSQARATDSGIVSGRKAELRATTETETLANLRNEIQGRLQRRSNIEQEKARAKKDVNDLYQTTLSDGRDDSRSKLRGLQASLQARQATYNAQLKRSYVAIEKESIFTRSAVRKSWEARLTTQENEIKDIEEKINVFDRTSYQKESRKNLEEQLNMIDRQFAPMLLQVDEERRRLSSELTRSIGTKEKDIEKRIGIFNVELASIETRFDKLERELKEQKDDALARFSVNSDRVDALDQELDSLSANRLELRKEINTRVGNNQVYRMAQMFYGKEQAADIDRKQVSFIAAIWFGSLAALIALTGIMLALASYVLKDQSEKNQSSEKYRLNTLTRRLIRSIRRYVVSKRRNQRLPIIKEVPRDVIQEVEVSRVVTVEKPVEIIVREVVHVPFYTNDKTLLNISEKSDSSENVRRKVTDGLAGKDR